MVGFLPVGYGDVLNDYESADQSGNCDSRPLRAAPAVVELGSFTSDDHIERTRGYTAFPSSGHGIHVSLPVQMSVWGLFDFYVGCRKVVHDSFHCILFL